MNSIIKQSQSGAALVFVLMMLLVMTLLGLSSMNSTVLEEKMAGNARNKHMSFHAAEAALRAGEIVAEGLEPSNFTDTGTSGQYKRSVPGDSSPKPAYPVWGQTGVNWQNSATISGLVQAPQYITENFGVVYRDADCKLQLPLPPGCKLPIYRVTAQGWGANINAQTILQSTYKKL